jgi:hypothetical protein
MRKRSVLNQGMRIASAVALLVAMTTSPLRSFHSNSASLRPEATRPHCAGNPARLSFPARALPTSATARAFAVKAIPSENEEEDRDSVPRSVLSFFRASTSVSAAFSAKLAGVRESHSFHPLRC